ncbi:MAG TPA: hypothetical protein VN924_01735 [Bryobacteraceae bacterium]|nr:hypothetical protein [Bryobacteraceae bacterium]
MQFADNRHATDDVLERYSMDCLAEPELAEFEEHLMVCEPCQDRLAMEDSIRRRVRDGAAILQRPRAAALWRLPKFAWSLGPVALGLVVFAASQWPSLRPSTAPPVVILLRTTRGAENSTFATAPAGKALTLTLDLAGVQQISVYTLEIVNAGGHPAFQSKGSPQDNKLQATLTRGLAAGAYFVRVYTPAGELLREYTLTVRG